MESNQFFKRSFPTVAALLVAVILLFSFNIFSTVAFKSSRLDLTSNKLHTLSDGTINILESIEEPVKLTLYYSKNLAEDQVAMQNYSNQVKELLDEYKRIAGQNLTLEYIDPEPFSEHEDFAIGEGLQGYAIDEEGSNFYFGLIGSNSTDTVKVIPFFEQGRQNYLEYDLTQLVYQLTHPNKPKVAVISSLPISGSKRPSIYGQGSKPWLIWEQITQNYNVEELTGDAGALPEDTNLLVLIAPQDLTEKTIYAIDQYVLGGGHLIGFLDPFSETGEQKVLSQDDGQLLNDLMKNWGVQLVANKVIADEKASKQVWFNNNGRRKTIEYPLWQDITKSRLDAKDLITADLEMLTLASPGFFKIKANPSTTITTLFSSTKGATEFSSNQIAELQEDPESLLRKYKPNDKVYPFAVRITGPVKSAYQTAFDTKSQHLSRSTSDINVVLFSDADMLNDSFWIKSQSLFGQAFTIPISSNAALVMNSLDNLSGSSDLIAIRSRAQYNKPFTKIREIQQRAERQFRSKEVKLIARLKEAEDRLTKMNDQKIEGNKLLLSAAQQLEINNFRQEQVTIRKELRSVRHDLQKDIEKLMQHVKLLNIGGMPLVIGLTGFAVGFFRRRKYQRIKQQGVKND